MKILFVGETWLGSCARSLKEALARNPAIELDELAEDAFMPKVRSRVLRVLCRLTRQLYRGELNRAVLEKVRQGRPEVLVVYKGWSVHSDLLQAVSALGVRTVNIYPDCSPHAHGKAHSKAVGQYDLVISTKAYHPGLWSELYGYRNHCVFVPQGYEPHLHLVPQPASEHEFDVVMVATYRAEYGRLISDFARALGDTRLRVAIGGHGWQTVKHALPESWILLGGVHGRDYVRTLRSGKICIAPLTRDVVINGQRQPGDVDTTRTYELAAAHCFFIHQRTDYVQNLYGAAGVPMFEDGAELARQVLHYLARPDERAGIALAAHQLAVPAFSVDARAAEIIEILQQEQVSHD